MQWEILPDLAKAPYRKLASLDLKRYQLEMKSYSGPLQEIIVRKRRVKVVIVAYIHEFSLFTNYPFIGCPYASSVRFFTIQ